MYTPGDLTGISETDPRYAPGGEPRGVIERRGRWVWAVSVDYQPIDCLPMTYTGEAGTFALGRKRAERKAARMLRRFVRREARTRETVTITEETARRG